MKSLFPNIFFIFCMSSNNSSGSGFRKNKQRGFLFSHFNVAVIETDEKS